MRHMSILGLGSTPKSQQRAQTVRIHNPHHAQSITQNTNNSQSTSSLPHNNSIQRPTPLLLCPIPFQQVKPPSTEWSSVNAQVCIYLHHLLYKMISPEINELMYLNRRSEKPFLSKDDLLGKMEQQSYQNLIVSHINEHPVFPIPFSCLKQSQFCSQLGISQATVFLSKIYLDLTIKRSSQIPKKDHVLLCICCIWVAIKFNESIQISSYFTLHRMHGYGDGSFTVEELNKAEVMIYRLLSFKLAYTTPYHYIDTFFQGFPWFKAVKKALPDIIDFAISIPQLSQESSENLFYAAFTSCLAIKHKTLNQLQQTVLDAYIVQPHAVRRIQKIIVHYYNIAIYGYDMDEQTQDEYSDEEK